EAAQHEAQVAQQSEAAFRRELEVILGSTIWRASAPLRMAAGTLPSSLRSAARTALRAVYWVLTPWDTPKRVRFLREQYRQEPGEAALEPPPTDSRTDAPKSISQVQDRKSFQSRRARPPNSRSFTYQESRIHPDITIGLPDTSRPPRPTTAALSGCVGTSCRNGWANSSTLTC